MDDPALREIETQLRSLLSEHGLGWVVEQVDELVDEGVYEVAAKRKGGAEMREKVERPSDARRGSSSVRPYTVEERVGMLLSCAQRAVRDGQALEDAVDEMLLAPADGPETRRGRLEFFDERTASVVRVVRHGEDRAARRSRAERLTASIDELAHALNVAVEDQSG